ncbi:hypothetical protein SXCC_03143 [Gluconacetobacter sp. SXCC-1]|nr:hypothetical protein SXCC_03143 [Gluconacetobacter sp. SXCC-1]
MATPEKAEKAILAVFLLFQGCFVPPATVLGNRPPAHPLPRQ